MSRFEIRKKHRFFETLKVDDPLKIASHIWYNNLIFAKSHSLDYTGRQNLTKLQTLVPDYTFPIWCAESESDHRIAPSPQLFKFPNLNVQNTLFFAILGVILYTVGKFKKPEMMEQF